MVTASGSHTSKPAMRYFFNKRVFRPARQWQAQEPPHPPEDVLDAELSEEPELPSLLFDAPSPGDGDDPSGLEADDELPPRKSVAYQPEPLSWNPAAVTCLLKAAAPQAGQAVRGASESFCSTSCAWPQEAQR